MRSVPCGDPIDPGYRRLRYCRYADDHILGFTGRKPRPRRSRASWRRSCAANLRWSCQRKDAHHPRPHPGARFLGYEIIVQHDDSKITGGRRMLNGTIALRVPLEVITAKCAPYRRRGKPSHRPGLSTSRLHIVRVYGAEYRDHQLLPPRPGRVRLHRLRWNAETSMLKTLGASTVHGDQVAARHKAKIETPYGLRTCFEPVPPRGQGGPGSTVRRIPLQRDKNKVISDPAPVQVPAPRKELVHRLLASRCELCGPAPRWLSTRSPSSPGSGNPTRPARVGGSHGQERRRPSCLPPLPPGIHAPPVTQPA